jgi:DNA-binding CsgD family transcriptional regulator
VNETDPTPNPESLRHESSVSPAADFIRFELYRRDPSETFIPPLLHVSEKGKILWGSSPALRLLRTYWGWTKPSAQLPTPLRRMVSCRAHTNGSSPTPLRSELLIGGRQGASLHVRLIEDNKRLLLLLYERSASPQTSAHGLTKREAEVFQWLAAGKSNKDIATILAISPRTVEKHLGRIFQYLGVETRTAAAAEFYRLSQNHPSSLP